MAQYEGRTEPEGSERVVNDETIKTWKSKAVVLKPKEACA